MTWATVPYATGSSSIAMIATTASDASGVEYFFDETSGNTGGTDSGWVTDPVYNDTGLSPSTEYTYTVQMRDSVPNTGTVSGPENAITDTTAGVINPPRSLNASRRNSGVGGTLGP